MCNHLSRLVNLTSPCVGVWIVYFCLANLFCILGKKKNLNIGINSLKQAAWILLIKREHLEKNVMFCRGKAFCIIVHMVVIKGDITFV